MSHSQVSTPPRPPLGPARTVSPLPPSRSNGTLARQFVDTHSATYAHLYKHEDEAVRREKLEAEQKALEEERMRGKEMREKLSRIVKVDKENVGGKASIGIGLPGTIPSGRGRGSWRPLSLVAKRQNTGVGHARSASHQIPSTSLPMSTLRSVSTPNRSSALAREILLPQSSLHIVDETSRPNSPTLSPSASEETHEGDATYSSEPKSTYSWATSFSGETAELRATATYLRQSFESPAKPEADRNAENVEEKEVLDTPEKVKRRRKRIVAIAHTVRQLEGVGSREAEDPNFYGELVKAWNDRPGFKPTPPAPVRDGLTDAPPALLPPPNLQPTTYGRYSALAPLPPPAMSPAFESHFGSPNTPHLFTPAMGDYSGPSSATLATFPPQEVYDYDDESENSGDLRTRSYRYSYASALHDLALEGEAEGGAKGVTEKAWLKSPLRWSGAWEGWGSGPAPRPQDEVQITNWSKDRQLDSSGADNAVAPLADTFYPPPLSSAPTQPDATGTVTPTSQQPGWGLGFMSAWWADRPPSSRTLAEAAGSDSHTPSQKTQQDFQVGECDAAHRNPSFLPTPTPSGAHGAAEEVGVHNHSTPGHHIHDTSFTPTTTTASSVSTPSFGMRIHASAERRWARPTLVHPEHSQPLPVQTTASWLVSIPMETSSSGVSLDSVSVRARPNLVTADSTSSNLTMTTRGGGEEREFPFSNHCRPPSCPSIPPPSSSDSSVSVPSEIHALRAEVARSRESMEGESEWLAERHEGKSRSLGGLGSGSFPSTRTFRPTMFRQEVPIEETKVQGLLERRHVRPLQLGEMLNPISTPLPELHIERQSSIFQLGTSTIDLPLCLAPTPNSIQTHFIPPPTTPVLPLTPSTPSDIPSPQTSDYTTHAMLPTNFLRAESPRSPRSPKFQGPSSDPSSSLCDSNGPDGDIPPVRLVGRARAGTAGAAAGMGMLDLRGQPQHCHSTGHSAEVQEGAGYRDATPSVMTAVLPRRHIVSPALFFWLGFVMPWCWFFGGWPVGSGGAKDADVEKGETDISSEKAVASRWIYHPDPWARRCRIAAVGLLPVVAIGGVVGVVVLGVMRGR